jgi:hypothetical protein
MSRTFTDEVGTEWVVREIANATMPTSLQKLLGPDRRRSGWLAFQSAGGERRRLSPYPSDWATVTDFEIIRWCAKAVRVPPAPARRDED